MRYVVYFEWKAEEEVVDVRDLDHQVLLLEDVALDGVASGQEREFGYQHETMAFI